MAQRAIREVDGKRLLTQWLPEVWSSVSDVAPTVLGGLTDRKPFLVANNTSWDELAAAYVHTLIMYQKLCMLSQLSRSHGVQRPVELRAPSIMFDGPDSAASMPTPMVAEVFSPAYLSYIAYLDIVP